MDLKNANLHLEAKLHSSETKKLLLWTSNYVELYVCSKASIHKIRQLIYKFQEF